MAGLVKPKLLVIGGPTATGKTALSVALARRFNGEVISADSMQLYRGLDVGTAKVTAEEAAGVPHHLVDSIGPEQTYSVADYVAAARHCIDEIISRGKLPLVVGGTGLYISSLLNGVEFTPQKPTAELRRALEQELEQRGREALYRELQELDPEGAACIHPNNTPRLLRALELYRSTGKTMSQQKAESRPAEEPYDALVFGLNDPDREALYRRIDRRVDRMLEQGILDEARQVWLHRSEWKTAAQAIGYKEFFPYFEGTAELEACTADLKQASRRYAKRQLTWFRHMPQVQWLDIGQPDVTECAMKQTEEFLHRGAT